MKRLIKLVHLLSLFVLITLSVNSVDIKTASASLTDGLVAHYTFDDNANDSTGANNGTLMGGPTYADGQVGKALNMDGVDDYVNTGSGINFSNALTVSAWVKPLGKGTNGGPAYLSIFEKGGVYTLAVREDGTIVFYLPGVKNWVTSDGNKNLFDGVWHHILGTYDGATQSIYIDGQLMVTTSSSGVITSNTTNVKIGGQSYYFKGLIDDVRLYNRGLTAGEVDEMYLSYSEPDVNEPDEPDSETPPPPPSTGPKTFYISSSQGNDSNNGLSESTPWKTLDEVYRQFNRPGGIKPGYKFLFKRGDTWEGQITLDNRGSNSGDPITIGAYGSGPKPIIYGDGRGLTWTAVPGQTGTYEANIGLFGGIQRVFENNTMYPHNFAERYNSLSVGQWATGAQGRNDLIWLKTFNGSIPTNTTRVFRSATISINNSKNIIIENLDMREVFRAVIVKGSDSIKIKDNDTHNTLDISIILTDNTNNSIVEDNNTDISGHSTIYFAYASDNNIMRNNVISGSYPTVSGITVPKDGDNAAIGLHTGTGNIIERNTINDTNGIDFFYENDAIIRYNRFTRSGSGTWPHGENILVYGNIGGILGNAVNPGTKPIKIFNNVFVGARGVFAGQGTGTYAGLNGPIIFKNNIVYNASEITNSPTINFGTVVDSDYNCFYSTRNRGYKYNEINATVLTTLSAYQAASGKDLHSVYGDPKLDVNYKLGAGSPCIDIGTNIDDLINFTYKDYDGVSAIKGLGPDAGAYESDFTGTLPPFVPYDPNKVPTSGLCNSQVLNQCSVGTVSGINSNTTHNTWTCTGLNGGANASCSIPKPNAVIPGECSTRLNRCSVGTVSNQTTNSTHNLWTCNGLNGGANTSCSKLKTAVEEPILIPDPIIPPPPIRNPLTPAYTPAYTPVHNPTPYVYKKPTTQAPKVISPTPDLPPSPSFEPLDFIPTDYMQILLDLIKNFFIELLHRLQRGIDKILG